MSTHVAIFHSCRLAHRRMAALLTMAAACVATVFAAATSFTVIPPSRAYEGGKFAVTFRLDNGEGSDMRVSQINGCTLLFGPSTSTSRSYQVINGQAQQSSRVEYTYTYRADRAGTFTIPEASITVDGKRLTTKPVKFTVEPASAAQTPPSSRPTRIDDADTQSADRAVNPSDVFVRIILSRSTAYEQEAIECTIKLYTSYSITEFFPTRQPSFDGFLIQELDLKSALNQEEVLNGRTYLTAILKKCIIFPQKSGRLTINSGNYDITVVQYENINMGGFISVRQPRERKIKVSSNSASIDIKPLPQPAPDGFSGAVGRFSVDSRLVGNRFLTNDPATLVYTISGTGNIKYIKEPDIDFPSEFELYTPQSNIDAHVSGNNVTGTMTIEYTFVPQSVGDFTIGSDHFVYFDPSEGRYVTLNTPSYNIKVGQGAAQAATRDQEAIAAKNSDILHIRLDRAADLAADHAPLTTRLWYWMLYIVALAALLTAVIVWRRNIRLAADVKGQRLAKAAKVARRRLAKARSLMGGNDSGRFYEELLKALTGYLGDKLAIPVSRMSRQTVDESLAAIGAPETLRTEISSILDACEMARYTPDSSSAVESVYSRAADAINSLESLKKNKMTQTGAKALTVVLTLLTAASALAADPAKTIAEADSAYSAEDYTSAAALYSEAAASGLTSAALYYNLGNAEYRLGHPGKAILNYERALRLDPTFRDARTNLDFVNSRIIDRPGERGTFLGNALDAAALWRHTDTWAWLAYAFFALTLAGVALYVFSSAITLRKTGFFGAIAALALSATSLFLALRGAAIATDDSQAVITAGSTILSTSPRTPKSRTEEAMLLHEGTKVRILDSVRSATDSVAPLWLDVEIDNAHRAWLDARAAERIRPKTPQSGR